MTLNDEGIDESSGGRISRTLSVKTLIVSVELGRDYVKLAVQEMPTIPLMAYNVFVAMDDTYWTGYPTAEDPYANPVPNWGNSRYMMVRLKPRGQ